MTCIQHITKENLFFLKDLLQLYRTKLISTRLTSKNLHIEKLNDIVYKDNLHIIAQSNETC